MRTTVYRLTPTNENRFCRMSEEYKGASDNSSERKRLSKILRKAMCGSLTHQQFFCLSEYANGVPQKQIAEELNVSCSTVCRHIKAAKTKLQRIAHYYS